ncbi:MAG: hypothetical protein ACE5Q6_27095, partial [Dehalococcoidia bacterium]
EHLDIPLLLVQVTTPLDLVRQRLAKRTFGVKSDDFSDADWPIYRQLQPYEEAVPGPHLLVDTSQDIAPAVEEVLRFVAAAEGR